MGNIEERRLRMSVRAIRLTSDAHCLLSLCFIFFGIALALIAIRQALWYPKMAQTFLHPKMIWEVLAGGLGLASILIGLAMRVKGEERRFISIFMTVWVLFAAVKGGYVFIESVAKGFPFRYFISGLSGVALVVLSYSLLRLRRTYSRSGEIELQALGAPILVYGVYSALANLSPKPILPMLALSIGLMATGLGVVKEKERALHYAVLFLSATLMLKLLWVWPFVKAPAVLLSAPYLYVLGVGLGISYILLALYLFLLSKKFREG